MRSDMRRDHRKIRAARTGIDRFLQHGAHQFRSADLDAGVAGQFQRIRKILQRIFGRERPFRKDARHDRLHAVVAQRKAVGRAFRQCIKQQLRIDAIVLRDRNRFRQRIDGLEQHHVVEDLRHLPRADIAAMRDVGGEAADQRLDRGVKLPRPADHDAERAVLGGLPRARDRRVGPRRALRLQLPGEFAGLADRGRAEIDHDLAADGYSSRCRRPRTPRAHVLRWAGTGTAHRFARSRRQPKRAISAPSARRRASGSAERSNAITRLPLFFTRLRQIGSPITPSPMKPMVLYSDILLALVFDAFS